MKQCIRFLRGYMKIKFEKSSFFKQEVETSGYIINRQGIFPKTDYLEHKIFKKEIKTNEISSNL